jgi:hypothetical protein
MKARFVIGLTALTVMSTAPAFAQSAPISRGKGWLWYNGSTAPANYQYNSTGGVNSVVRTGVGQYRAIFPGLGTNSGTVHVTAYGGNHHCKVVNWFASGRNQQVNIRCFTPTGVLRNGSFSALFYKESGTGTPRSAYLWADQPAAAAYVPSISYRYNSAGAINTVRRLNVGVYQALLPNTNSLSGLRGSGGTVLVTAYGTGSERCKVDNWQASGANTLVNVRCFQGNLPVDSRYTLTYTSDAALRRAGNRQHGGYAWKTGNTLPIAYQFNTKGFINTVNAAGVVRFPRLRPLNKSLAIATAYGSNSDYCSIQSWVSGAPGVNTDVTLQCFNSAGALLPPVSRTFALTYLTNERLP